MTRRSLRTSGLRHRSIRIRVLAIALIPCAALLVTGSVAVAGLVQDARSAYRWSDYLTEQLNPLVTFIIAVQNERTASLAALDGSPQTVAELQRQRAKTDAALAEIARLAPQMQALNENAVAQSTPAFAALAAQAPIVRKNVDARQASATEVDDFYTRLADVIAMGLEGLAHYTPDSLTAAEEMSASDLMRMTDLHSRAIGFAAAAAPHGTLPLDDRHRVTELTGAYRHQLDGLTSRLTGAEQSQLRKLRESPQWRTAVESEDQLADEGDLPIPFGDWRVAEQSVDTELMALFKGHAQYANGLASDAAHRSLVRSIVAGTGVAIIAVTTFAFAVLLANRLVRRLRSLRSRTLQLANETLPAIVERLHDGEHVDIDAEMTQIDDRDDEIGQVAAAFGSAQRTAMIAAATEARTRDGFNKVFLDIAYRSQVIVRRQLDVLDLAENKQDDPEHLELLFQLDHLATRARRNAENLLILGGAQPGRRWRQPVALEQIVRSAASETQDLARVSAIRLPQAHVLGTAVADLVHLLAELIDNATAFSPPQSPVTVHGNIVGRGAVVEVEDQGLGIRFDERERLNELLRDPPDFQEMALAGQRHLGLFVVSRLAHRHGITVSLQESAYGGIKAIVLVPTKLLDSSMFDAEPVAAAIGWASGPTVIDAPVRPAHDPVPRLPGREYQQLPPWPTEIIADVVEANGSAPAQHTAIPFEGRHASAPTAGSRNPLPRRQRQAHLAPQLRVDDDATDAPSPATADRLRPAAEVRQAMASFQRGTRQARARTYRTPES
ncbi:nitrate- and nitrite sensing domain-containing protein [Nocardia sp. NPDC059239]|uniref:sensor histidine kinase n=1 Tax=unclassified Nocardia TaxID=2637762 RepID=UPI0036CC7720